MIYKIEKALNLVSPVAQQQKIVKKKRFFKSCKPHSIVFECSKIKFEKITERRKKNPSLGREGAQRLIPVSESTLSPPPALRTPPASCKPLHASCLLLLLPPARPGWNVAGVWQKCPAPSTLLLESCDIRTGRALIQRLSLDR